jgi:hypothetical protein
MEVLPGAAALPGLEEGQTLSGFDAREKMTTYARQAQVRNS